MPGIKHHQNHGFLAGLFASAAHFIIKSPKDRQLDIEQLITHSLIGGLTGFVTGGAPDILEPAYHSHHRKTAHSYAALGGVLTFGINTHLNSNVEIIDTIKVAAAASYAKHLIDDSKTPRGLRLI